MNFVYFSADWCGPCKMFKPVLQQVSQQMGVQVNYVNVDYDASHTQRYSVTSVPTLMVIDQDGKERFRHSGGMSAQQLTDLFNRFR